MFSRQQELFGWTLWCPKRESRQVSTPLKKDFATEMALTSLETKKLLIFSKHYFTLTHVIIKRLFFGKNNTLCVIFLRYSFCTFNYYRWVVFVVILEIRFRGNVQGALSSDSAGLLDLWVKIEPGVTT